MVQLSDIEFEILLQNATVEKFSGNEYTIFNDSHDEFYFYYDSANKRITDQGDIKISGEQCEKVCELAHEQFVSDLEESQYLNNLEGETTDYYKEYGLTPEMFLNV